MKTTLNHLLDLIDEAIHSKPVKVMNIALWLVFVCIVFILGIL